MVEPQRAPPRSSDEPAVHCIGVHVAHLGQVHAMSMVPHPALAPEFHIMDNGKMDVLRQPTSVHTAHAHARIISHTKRTWWLLAPRGGKSRSGQSIGSAKARVVLHDAEPASPWGGKVRRLRGIWWRATPTKG